MAQEIWLQYSSGKNLYACRFQEDGDVFLTDGSAAEVWGTGGHTADSYDVAMTEEDSSGHYTASFDASANIGQGRYRVVVFKREGASPNAAADPAIAEGVIEWNGTAEVTLGTVSALAAAAMTMRASETQFQTIYGAPL